MTNYAIYTETVTLLEALDIFSDPSNINSHLDRLFSNLDTLETPVYMSTSSSLRNLIKHNNLRFVDAGNVDIEGIHKIIQLMEIEQQYSADAIRCIRRIINELFDINMNINIISNNLRILTNLPEMDNRLLLDNILSGVAQLIQKRKLIESLNTLSEVDKELIDRIPVIYDMTTRISWLMRETDIPADAAYLRSNINVLMKTIEGTTVMKEYSNMCIQYLLSVARHTFSEHTDLLEKITGSFTRENLIMEGFVMLEHVSARGLVASNLETEKNKKRFELLNISMEVFGNHSFMNKSALRVDDIIEDFPGDSLITDTLTNLKGVIHKPSIKRYGKDLTLEIEPSDVFKLSHTSTVESIMMSSCTDGTPVYFVANHSNLELVSKDIVTEDIILISLISENTLDTSLYNLTKETIEKGGTGKLSYRVIKFKDAKDMLYTVQEDLYLLNEGLRISEDGGIKLTYQPKKSYMDEYAEAHRIIHQNYKAGNYEAMKTDLAFLFAFINHIESQVIYSNKPAKASKKEDAFKARMFAINDFKTYLKKVQDHEPTFDFTKYFEKIDTQKVLVEFSNSEIKGIRKLVRAILNF